MRWQLAGLSWEQMPHTAKGPLKMSTSNRGRQVVAYGIGCDAKTQQPASRAGGGGQGKKKLSEEARVVVIGASMAHKVSWVVPLRYKS